ncbi:PAS domain S-box protein (plasmid) [Haloferax larsenii]|uniref:histidine kinase n=1 Tax=Haloferax larsenii TaxID=302484 RepID=A0ABY5RML7_HALLR|nr:ATP-binding protein [Haloferax larsenii]UVE52248.1 PAS domain S-box protein [Haloferax larsenii]
MSHTGEHTEEAFWRHLNEAAIVVDSQSETVHDVNSVACDRLKYPAEKLVEQDVEVLVPDGDSSTVRRLLKNGSSDRVTVSLRRGDETSYRADVSVSKLPQRDSDLRLLLAREADTTSQEGATTGQSKVVLKTILENLTLGTLVEDENRDVLMVNEALGEALGVPLDPESMIGRDCAQAAEEMKGLFADPERFIDSNDEFIEQRELVRGQELELADGRTIVRDYVPYELPNGDANLWIYRDITAQKRREKERDRHQNLLRQLQEVAEIGGWEVDFRTDELTWTEKTYEIHRLPADADIDLSDAIEFYHPDDREAIRDAFERLRSDNTPYDLELRIVTTDDAVRWVRARGEPWVVDGETVGARGTFQDITERVHREQRVEDQRDSLEVLNQVIRHDIRNDLQLVLAYADLLDEELDDDNEHLDRISSAARHSVEVTENAQMMAGIFLGDDQEYGPTSLVSLLRDELDHLCSTFADARIEVSEPLPDVTVWANEMLRPVVRNLVGNAVQHNDKDTAEVTVDVRPADETVQLRVADNGPGVPPERREAVFGKGNKGLESGGTGLGLYLVKTIVDRFDGTVWIEDNDPEGAVFVVELPKHG